ncbi:MAG: GNAT family N-acetyltransferase [Rhizobiales bacterium]|nr:GNAT family N-acetyltransferase [Hyphomicrobiales bacterium]
MVVARDDFEDTGLSIERPVIRTARLVLRRPNDGDIPALAELADNRRIAEMLARMPHPYGAPEARSFVAMAQGTEKGGATYALALPGTDLLVGCAGLNATERGLELGYWVGEPYWNEGYATEAAHALVDLAFTATPVQVLHAACRVINPASRRVVHKCGFQYAGQGMIDSLVAGRVPVERYRLDRKAWASLKSWGAAA